MGTTVATGQPVAVQSSRCGTRRTEGWREVGGPDMFELCLVREGCFRYRDDRGELLVDPGMGVFGDPHRLGDVAHPAPGGDTDTFVFMSAAAVAGIGGGAVALPLAIRTTPWIDRVHRRLLACSSQDQSSVEAEELALTLFASALAQPQPVRVRSGWPRTERARCRLVDDARTVLAYDHRVNSLVDLARLVGCSPHHLSRLFVTYTGMGVARYRARLRVQRALDRLLDGGMSLAEVAADCGFADHAHLTRTLREHVDATPAELRARLAGAPRRSSTDVQASTAHRDRR